MQALPYILYGMLVVLGICVLFFVLEKPLHRFYIRWSDTRFQRRTGIDLGRHTSPFE